MTRADDLVPPTLPVEIREEVLADVALMLTERPSIASDEARVTVRRLVSSAFREYQNRWNVWGDVSLDAPVRDGEDMRPLHEFIAAQ